MFFPVSESRSADLFVLSDPSSAHATAPRVAARVTGKLACLVAAPGRPTLTWSTLRSFTTPRQLRYGARLTNSLPRPKPVLAYTASIARSPLIPAPRLLRYPVQHTSLLHYFTPEGDVENTLEPDIESVGKQGLKPMKLFLQFIATPTADTPGTTLLLHFDDRRYIIGHVSEGTQRACVERGIRLSRVSDIFFTGRTEWKNNGGLMGLLLTLADSMTASTQAALDVEYAKLGEMESKLAWAGEGTPTAENLKKQIERRREHIAKISADAVRNASLRLHGAPNLAHSLATGRTFVCRKGMPISIQEFGDDGVENVDLSNPTWADENVKTWAMAVRPSNSRAPSPRNGKRSYTEYKEVEYPDGVSPEYAAQRKVARAECGHVVSEMFNSNWRPDVLVEMPLSQVPMPAAIFVKNAETGKVEEYTGPKPGDEGEIPDINVLVRKPWPGATIEKLPDTSPSPVSMSYIIRSHDLRGKFDTKKATELRVKPGADFGRLARGESVVSMDGETITSEMVLGAPRPGRGMAILDLPSTDYIEPLLNRPEWNTPEAIASLEVCVWILGPGVAEDRRLQEFMTSKTEYKHIVSSADYCANPIVFKAVGRATTHFSVLDEERYQVPLHNNRRLPPPGWNQETKPGIQTAVTGLTVEMEPNFKITLDKKQEATLDIKYIKNGVRDNVLREASQIRQQLERPEFVEKHDTLRQKIPGSDAEIIALGTGSSLPSSYRNVSGTLLRVPGSGSYLLDAGEGTLGQLRRVLSPSEFTEVMRDLKMIWISHLHADHHLGTVSMIKAWHREVFGCDPPATAGPESEEDIRKVLSEKRLFVVSAKHMLSWLTEYACAESYGFNKIVPLIAQSATDSDGNVSAWYYYNPVDKTGQPITLPDSTQSAGHRLQFYPENDLTSLFQQATGLQSLLTVPVPHCTGAKAVSLTFPSGFKLSYSGDCRPSPLFTTIGQNSTVLLHEATFEDEMKPDAIAKRHSTVSEALMVAKKMNAAVVVLTHFSQRYREMPVVNRDKVRLARFDDYARAQKSSSTATVGGASEVDGIAPKVRDIPATDGTEDSHSHGTVLVHVSGSGEDRDDEGGLSPDVPVVLAFDYMRLKVGDAMKAEAYMPAFRKYLMSAEDVES